MQESAVNHVRTLLRWVYGIVPVVAGLDKFFNILVDWSVYAHPTVESVVSISVFMMLVGIVEIVVGFIVLAGYTRVGGYIVALWLTLIAINLVAIGAYDIAVRDLVMASGAYSLAVLTFENDQSASKNDRSERGFS